MTFRDNLIPIVWKSIVPIKGYEESRREQAQLHEELTQREEALGYTRIRNLHEVEELKRAQEMQIDEFFIHKFKESHATIVPSFGGMLSRDPSLRHDTRNLFGTSGNVFNSPRAVVDSSSTPYQGMLHSLNQSTTGENPVRETYRQTCR